MKSSLLIFSGYNQRAVVAFLRTLEKHQVNYGIIACSKQDPIFLTSYSKKVVSIRSSLDLDYYRISKSIKEAQQKTKANKYIIAPSTEAMNRFILENRQKLESINCEVPLVSKTVYESISDKEAFGKICSSRGIPVPASYDRNETIVYPFVAKPKKYLSSDEKVYTPTIILNEDSRRSFEAKHNKDDFYYQEYIEGPSYYLFYYFFKKGGVIKFSQKNLIQQPFGKSVLAAIPSDIHLTHESKKYETLFSELSYEGLVMVEIKKHKRKNYMIEANPRFWGPSQLMVDTGSNLFEGFLIDNQLTRIQSDFTIPKRNIYYFWLGGFVETTRAASSPPHYYGYSYSKYLENFSKLVQQDIYNRQDTRELFEKELYVGDHTKSRDLLIKHFSKNSKHSNYQVLPTALRPLLKQEDIQIHSRYEEERLKYVIERVDINAKSILDIGGNSGFFTFELISAGANKVLHYEGNKEHSEFVKLAAKLTGFDKKVTSVNEYFSFDGSFKQSYDVVLLFNVLHHLGDDYGKKYLSRDDVLVSIIEQLNSLKDITKKVIFQMGFNWQGDPGKPLFNHGTKKEMISYIVEGTKPYWDISNIGVATKKNGKIAYNNLNKDNEKRNDSLGEFLNRPIFIMNKK